MSDGISKSLYYHASHLPEDIATRDAVLLVAMRSHGVRGIEGMEGGYPPTSKVAVVNRSARADADVEFSEIMQ